MDNNNDNDSNNDVTIDVWVGGDGSTWSLRPTKLYRIPTDLFNYSMSICSLETESDLQLLIDKVSEEENVIYDEYTDVYVGADSTWSGLPSVLYKIPADVFGHLQTKGNTEKTIGLLENDDDLQKLIEKTRYEIKNGPIDVPIVCYSKPNNKETKNCGHICTASNHKDGCCYCMDQRPMREEGTYPTYLDGIGYKNVAKRNEFYCHICTD